MLALLLAVLAAVIPHPASAASAERAMALPTSSSGAAKNTDRCERLRERASRNLDRARAACRRRASRQGGGDAAACETERIGRTSRQVERAGCGTEPLVEAFELHAASPAADGLAATQSTLLEESWPYGFWPQRIRYVIDENVDFGMRRRIEAAVAHWNEHTLFELFPAEEDWSTELFVKDRAPYLSFRRSDDPEERYCLGQLGQPPVGLGREITLIPACSEANIIHEIGHVLGLYHEHQRPDAERYITIYFENIKDEDEHAFEREPGAGTVGPFDFQSIMLYGSFNSVMAEGDDPRLVLMSRKGDPTRTWTANRLALSPGDIAGASVLAGRATGAPRRLRNGSGDRCLLHDGSDGIDTQRCGYEGDPQKWWMYRASGGLYHLINKKSGSCFGIGSTGWPYMVSCIAKDENQKFRKVRGFNRSGKLYWQLASERNGQCLAYSAGQVLTQRCDSTGPSQQLWLWE